MVMVLGTIVSGGNDQDGSGIPDDCELPDCDNDTISNADESADCGGDPSCADCNNNLIPDACDLADCSMNDASCGDCQPDGVPDECQLAGSSVITQSDSLSLSSQVSCYNSGSDCTNSNWSGRCFPVSTSTVIDGLTFGVLETNGPPPTATSQIQVNLWADNDATCPPGATGSATLLRQAVVPVSNSQEGQLVTVMFSPAVSVPGGTALIAEVGTAQNGCGIGAGVKFITAANGAGQTGPSYLRSAPCGLPDWTDYAAIGFGDLHTVLTLNAIVPEGNDQNRNAVPDDCELTPSGDCDGDDRVDTYDVAHFQNCYTGANGGPIPPLCVCVDLDRDGDVDLNDWRLFLPAITGS